MQIASVFDFLQQRKRSDEQKCDDDIGQVVRPQFRHAVDERAKHGEEGPAARQSRRIYRLESVIGMGKGGGTRGWAGKFYFGILFGNCQRLTSLVFSDENYFEYIMELLWWRIRQSLCVLSAVHGITCAGGRFIRGQAAGISGLGGISALVFRNARHDNPILALLVAESCSRQMFFPLNHCWRLNASLQPIY